MKLRIEQDSNAPSPREARDNLGKIVHWHGRIDLGQRVADREAGRAAIPPGSVVLPISLFDHSCVRLWVTTLSDRSAADPGDSGHIGYIYATPKSIPDKFRNEHANDPLLRAEIRRCLSTEIKEFDQYLRGDVWRYVVEDENCKQLDSCGNIYGPEDAEREGQKALALAEFNRALFTFSASSAPGKDNLFDGMTNSSEDGWVQPTPENPDRMLRDWRQLRERYLHDPRCQGWTPRGWMIALEKLLLADWPQMTLTEYQRLAAALRRANGFR